MPGEWRKLQVWEIVIKTIVNESPLRKLTRQQGGRRRKKEVNLLIILENLAIVDNG